MPQTASPSQECHIRRRGRIILSGGSIRRPSWDVQGWPVARRSWGKRRHCRCDRSWTCSCARLQGAEARSRTKPPSPMARRSGRGVRRSPLVRPSPPCMSMLAVCAAGGAAVVPPECMIERPSIWRWLPGGRDRVQLTRLTEVARDRRKHRGMSRVSVCQVAVPNSSAGGSGAVRCRTAPKLRRMNGCHALPCDC